jgi:transcriptional regulator with XRE-family HTH domain
MRNSTLAAEIARAGFDCIELGRRTGYDPQTIRNLIQGKQLPSRQTAEAIAKALHLQPAFLFPAIASRTAWNTRLRRAAKTAGVAK